MTTTTRIRPRERDALLQSLRAGVVPRVGQQHVQVGRVAEVRAMLTDVERITDGGSALRFVIGDYGAGKTFFLHLVRSIAMEKRLVTAHADLNPDRRLHATGGQARGLYAELMRNMATRSKPDGGALASVIERFVSTALAEAEQTGKAPDQVIRARMADLSELTGGYDFAEVIGAYWRGHDSGDEHLKSAAVRWLRGEYATRTDARAALGVRTIIDDGTMYDHLKLMSRFVRLAGFGGLLICADEMVNLYKLASTRARNANYEQILRILNDTLQGSTEHLGFLFGGTSEFLRDSRRGLFSYPALQSRLADNAFAANGLVDLAGPILELQALTQEDFYVLLTKLRHVHAAGDESARLLPDEAILAFMKHCSETVGDTYFRTPRTTIKAFCDLLAILEQNPGTDWQSLVGSVTLAPEHNPDLAPLEEEDLPSRPGPEARGDSTTRSQGDHDDLTSFRL